MSATVLSVKDYMCDLICVVISCCVCS